MPINTPNMGSIITDVENTGVLFVVDALYFMHCFNSIFCGWWVYVLWICIMYTTIVYIMEPTLRNLSHYGDILAIPFFYLLIVYFYKIQNKTTLEYVLLAFAICGFVLDIFYTYVFVNRMNNSSF